MISWLTVRAFDGDAAVFDLAVSKLVFFMVQIELHPHLLSVVVPRDGQEILRPYGSTFDRPWQHHLQMKDGGISFAVPGCRYHLYDLLTCAFSRHYQGDPQSYPLSPLTSHLHVLAESDVNFDVHPLIRRCVPI